MSKRRKGYPSEAKVKRGQRIVHGMKELVEKLGRNDPCPCGSGRRFKQCCLRLGCMTANAAITTSARSLIVCKCIPVEMKSSFIKGLDLSRQFYTEAVRPILDAHFPECSHSAGLLLHGSDALGFDTSQSMDHDWGPRVQLFLDDTDDIDDIDDMDDMDGMDIEVRRSAINEILQEKLPREFHGFSTHFGRLADGVTWMEPATDANFQHGVKIFGLRAFFESALKWDVRAELQVQDWLSFPQQILRSLTGNGIFHDGLNQLRPIQDKLRYYPHELWLYLLACQWQRIGQEEPFMGRCGQAGDELGSRIIAARLIRDVMRLCFLIERQYVPYSKWFGTAFAQLACARDLTPMFAQVLDAQTWQDRENHLSRVYEVAAALHNRLNLTEPLSTQVSSFHDRPFQVIQAEQFADALRATITDAEVQALPRFGAIDQLIDSTDVLSNPDMFDRIKALYRR